MLNVTGCELITTNGLKALIQGLKYVEAGISFFGFKPIDRHVEKKLADQMNMLRETEIKRLNDELDMKSQEIKTRKRAEKQRLNNAAKVIQGALYRYSCRMYYYDIWWGKHKIECAVTVQRVYRGYIGRHKSTDLRRDRRLFLSKSPQAVIIQSLGRGYIARRWERRVAAAVRNMYERRRREAFAAISVRLQAIGRKFLTNSRLNVHKELFYRRRFDETSAALTIQSTGRMFLAILEVNRRRLVYQRRLELERIAANRIVNFYLRTMTRYRNKLIGLEIQRRQRAVWAASYLLQRVIMGHLGREKVARMRIREARRVFAVITIQRVYRGSRVLHWRDLRLNVIAAYVLDRQYLERRERIAAARFRYKQFIEANKRDSASEEEDERDRNKEEGGGGGDGGGSVGTWVKCTDYKKGVDYWMNMMDGEVVYEEPLGTLVKEKSMVGTRIRVYWVAQGAWYNGIVTRFNVRKHR
jgi:hypothetical protein